MTKLIPKQEDPDEEWRKVSKYYCMEFDEGDNLKKPLIDAEKRKCLLYF